MKLLNSIIFFSFTVRSAAFHVPKSFNKVSTIRSDVAAPTDIRSDVAAPTDSAPTSNCVSKEAILCSPNNIEFGKIWDPLNLVDSASDATMAWYRHAEVKVCSSFTQ